MLVSSFHDGHAPGTSKFCPLLSSPTTVQLSIDRKFRVVDLRFLCSFTNGQVLLTSKIIILWSLFYDCWWGQQRKVFEYRILNFECPILKWLALDHDVGSTPTSNNKLTSSFNILYSILDIQRTMRKRKSTTLNFLSIESCTVVGEDTNNGQNFEVPGAWP